MSTVYVALDIEATGMNPATDRIIEIAAVKFTPERVLDRWSALVRPGVPVPFAITALTGITDEQLRRAPPVTAVLAPLRAFVRDHPIVGQSVAFDLDMLKAAGLPLPNLAVDTFELAALLLPQLPAYGLGAVAEALGVDLPAGEHHRATADAELTRRVFLALWERLVGTEPETLAEVVRLTAGAGWPLHRLFVEAQREATRSAFGVSVGGALRTALGARGDAAAGELASLIPRARHEPLEPTGDGRPLDATALEAALTPDGPFARRFPGYEHRPQQVEMLRAVTRAFNEAGQLLVEAGTGTGKSLAYLLPAVAAAVRRGETVVVATKTIQLQDQLFHKDLPALKAVLAAAAEDGAARAGAALPATFTAALLKGRTNYLCLRRWFAVRRLDSLPSDEVRTLVKILLWLQTTETGDRAELRLLPGEETTWARVMATPEACTQATCPYHRRGQCYLARARRAAEAAHVVVVNHALLLSDMVANSQVLPAHKHLIVDEAHRLEDEATAQLGYSVNRWTVAETFEGLARPAGARVEGLTTDILTLLRVAKAPTTLQQAADRAAAGLIETVASARRLANELFDRVAAFVAARERPSDAYDSRLRLTPSVRRQEGWADIETAWAALDQALAGVGHGLDELARAVERVEGRGGAEHDLVVGELAGAQRANGELLLHLSGVIANPDPAMVYWCEASRAADGVALHAAPLHVGAALQAGLYQDKRTLVLTSATLTTGNRFTYVRERLGLADARELQVGSPFDYRRAALLYLVNDVPEPGRPGYQRAVEQGLIDLCRATGGRALALFTSHSALRATYAAVKAPLEGNGILVLGQRIDGSPRQLLERLKATGQAVVLGTASFWEGVDLVGDALSVLVIVKLPFKVPTDPVFAARCEAFDDPFSEFAVPQTILTFKQGFGRLIRSQSDRGVVAVLDRRLLTKSYGRAFIDSLPPCTRRDGPLAHLPRQARAWLAGPPATDSSS